MSPKKSSQVKTAEMPLKENTDYVEVDPMSDSSIDKDSGDEKFTTESDANPDFSKVVQAAGIQEDSISKLKQNRSEKKARKMLSRLGLKLVPGIVRVTVKKSKNLLFVIQNPDVYKSPCSDTYIVFGEAKIEDLSQQPAMKAAERLKSAILADKSAAVPDTAAETPIESLVAAEQEEAAALVEEAEESDSEQDSTGIEEKDIEMVMNQANVSRSKAIKTLRKKDLDVVDAIMELTI
ncbi:hypothetical protein GJ496_000358 [Pomphorhynchus laevis]|nr:hypothetical protein GJ496_000358 [Pomphorhynchus laevis]